MSYFETNIPCKDCSEPMSCETESRLPGESGDIRITLYCNNDDCGSVDIEYEKILDFKDFDRV